MPDCGKIYSLSSNLKNLNTNAKGTVVVVLLFFAATLKRLLMTGVWLDLNVEWFRAPGTEVKQSVGHLRLLLAVATAAQVALI